MTKEKNTKSEPKKPKGWPMANWDLTGKPADPKLHGKKKSNIIKVPKATEYSQAWVEFMNYYDKLFDLSPSTLKATRKSDIISKISKLRKYLLIYYETFNLKNNDVFKARLKKFTEDDKCVTLQVVFGMKAIATELDKDIKSEIQTQYPGKKFMSCIMFVGRDAKGKVIPGL